MRFPHLKMGNEFNFFSYSILEGWWCDIDYQQKKCNTKTWHNNFQLSGCLHNTGFAVQLSIWYFLKNLAQIKSNQIVSKSSMLFPLLNPAFFGGRLSLRAGERCSLFLCFNERGRCRNLGVHTAPLSRTHLTHLFKVMKTYICHGLLYWHFICGALSNWNKFTLHQGKASRAG